METYKSSDGNIELKLLGYDEPNNGRMLYVAKLYIKGVDVTFIYFKNKWNRLNFTLNDYIFESFDFKWIFIPAEGDSFIIDTDTFEQIFLPWKGLSTIMFIKNEFINNVLRLHYKDEVVDISLNKIINKVKPTMKLTYKDNCSNIDWERVRSLLKEVGMSYVEVDKHRISFENSYAVIFVFDEDKMIGMGRSISDGIRHSAIYDVAIDPQYQGLGIGKKIVSSLMDKTPNCTFILYAAPGKENFYRKMGYKKMKTGMILFSDPSKMNSPDFIDDTID